jgi:hypothetical protein
VPQPKADDDPATASSAIRKTGIRFALPAALKGPDHALEFIESRQARVA